MPVYLCRWQNGDFSVVQARDKMEAMELLDDVGDASEGNLMALHDFMVHFALEDNGEFELEGFGEKTNCYIEDAYPALFADSVFTPDDERDPALLREAAKKEKARLWPKKNLKNPGEGALITEEGLNFLSFRSNHGSSRIAPPVLLPSRTFAKVREIPASNFLFEVSFAFQRRPTSIDLGAAHAARLYRNGRLKLAASVHCSPPEPSEMRRS